MTLATPSGQAGTERSRQMMKWSNVKWIYLREIRDQGIDFRDLRTTETSLEDIFVSLVGQRR